MAGSAAFAPRWITARARARIGAGLLLAALAASAARAADAGAVIPGEVLFGSDAVPTVEQARRAPVPELDGLADDEIALGVVLPLSGAFETYGQSALTGVVARTELHNAAARAQRQPRLRLIVRDSHSDVRLAHAHADALTRDSANRCPAIVGPLLSDMFTALRDLAAERRVVMVSPLSIAASEPADQPWQFRIAASGRDQARAMAHFMAEFNGVRRAAVVTDPRFPISAALGDAFQRAFTRLGGEIVAEATFSSPNPAHGAEDGRHKPTDFGAVLGLLRETKPDAVYLPFYALEITEFVQAVGAESELRRLELCGPDFWDNELVFDGSGRRVDRAAFTSALFESGTVVWPVFDRFMAAMRQSGVDVPDAQTVCAYDAVSLVIDAIRHGGRTAEAMQAYLAQDRAYDLATGRTTITARGQTFKRHVQLRLMEIRDGWPTPAFSQLPPGFRPSAPPVAEAPAVVAPAD